MNFALRPAATILPQRLRPRSRVPVHSHPAPYAALVLEGSYLEFGDGGRRLVDRGQLLVHAPFTAHADVTGTAGATIVNIALPIAASLRLRHCHVDDPEELLRAAADSEFDLARHLEGCDLRPAPADALDLLASELERPGELRLEQWADQHGLSPRSLRRHFHDALGMTPAHYRWRARTRGAWRTIISTREPLSSIAADWAFSDQAHLTRSIRQLTGRTPHAWRSTSALSD